MGATSIPAGSALAVKHWSEALFVQVGKQPTPINALSGPAPKISRATGILRRQSTTDMPIVRVTDLAQTAGDNVRMDCANVIKLRPVMGDENAEGKGAKLDFSYMDVRIDMATLPVSAGGKMTQKRMQHDLRTLAYAQLKGGIPNFLWQRVLVAMAGARGDQDGIDWVLPLASDPDFAAMMVNAVQAPTFNRHYVVDGDYLVQGGQQLANIDTTDKFKLTHGDQVAALISEMSVRMLPIRIPGDPAAGDDPIRAVALHDNLAWDALITDTTNNANIRQWQAAAGERARWGDLSRHPLFAAGAFLWNGVLHRKMGDFGVRFNPGSSVKYVAAADRYSATESTATIPALSGCQVSRTLVLGAQALADCLGANQDTGVPTSMLENSTNYGRNLEVAGEVMGACAKVRFGMPDGQGNKEPTDIGVVVIDSVTRKLAA